MHIFFWFFKQLYYLLKHFKLKNFLLLLAFFVIAFFLFIKPSLASSPSVITRVNYNGTTYYFDYPLTLTNENNCYYIVSSNDLSTFYVIEPNTTTDYLVTYDNLSNSNQNSITDYLKLRGYNNSLLTDVKIYSTSYNGSSWSQWSDTTSTAFILVSNSNRYNFITGNNVQLYTQIGSSLNTKKLFTENDLPTDVKFTDNICFISRSNNTTYLLYTDNPTNYFYFTGSMVQFKCYTENDTTTSFKVYSYNSSTNTWSVSSNSTSSFNTGVATGGNVWYSTNKISFNGNVRNAGFTDFFNYIHAETLPYIENTDSSIENWTFENLVINGGTSVGLSDNYYLLYTYPDNNTSYRFNINQYFDLSNGTIFFNIPRTRINEDIVVRPSTNIYFTLICERNLEGGTSNEVYNLSGYTLTLSQESANIINEDSDKQLISDLKQEQQQTTQAIESLENTITDTNIDNSSITLPTDTTTDITRDGLNNIFTMLYNAFCTGTPQDIVLPIPYTNKSITINPNYLHDMLYNYTGTWLINIIEAFYWYIISRFIIKDIVNKINKIKSGDLEKIETSNIKGDML